MMIVRLFFDLSHLTIKCS